MKPTASTSIGFVIGENSLIQEVVRELTFLEAGIVTTSSWEALNSIAQASAFSQIYLDYAVLKNCHAVCEDIRRTLPGTGIVILAEYQNLNDLFSASDWNFDRFLLKPVGVRQLLYTIQTLSAELEARRKLREAGKELQFARERLEEVVRLVDQKYPGGLEALSASNEKTVPEIPRQRAEKHYSQVQNKTATEDRH
ncbi:MAG: response regulator [Candidatus Neomarinimicrobiota bacterium]|nr:MAG: response regulator [Candidatus Neomarinimicrobiota bacterium]